jgi:hypothetical protein
MKNTKPSQTPGVRFVSGVPVNFPNTVYDGEGFYISYNDRDCRIYGDVTTALVHNSSFYILNGDHRERYGPLLCLGIDQCLDYFISNIHMKNKYSETPSGYATMVKA